MPPPGPPQVIPNPTWPWIARLALELGAHPPESIERALAEQAAHPQQALDAFLEFEQADREKVLQELKENPARFTAEVEEQALRRLEASNEPAPGTNAPTAALTCNACRIQVELPAPLLPFVPHCPACGAEVPRLPPPTPPPSDLDPKLAHPWLLDEALARWAVAFGGATPEQVAQARTESEIGALCEVLVVRCGLSLEAVMEVMADEVDVRCTGCSAVYAVGVRLHRCLDAMECPLCAAELTSTETTIVRRREIHTEDQTCVTSRAGPYLLIRRLGYGGMSDVYLGEGPEGPQVAVKILSALLRGEVSRERFAREAELLKTLEHPNVIRTLDFGVGEATARPYIALELVRGRDLLAILRDREAKHLTPAEVVFVLERCARALQYAHEQGVIHRDVKPGNLLVDPESNEVKLTDFGIALRMDEASRLTVDSEVLGTPMYLSPEVIMTGDWTPAADLYALGALGWRLLTGGSFVTAGEAFSREKRRVPTEDELHSAAPDAPSELNRLVLALLASEPSERPGVAEVLETLTPLLPPLEALQALFRESAIEAEDDPTHANPTGSRASLAEGHRFDKYVIEEEIGRGGMGAVYRAYHPQLEQRVALKLLVPDALESEAQRVRFLREAQAASALKHPAIVPVLDAGEHDGTCYLVMDLVDGRSLSALIREATPPPREQLLRLFVRMCEGVHHAHLRGVIHRDLKPDNVMVDREGEPRLLDFGMAKKIDQKDEHDVTTEGDIVGTIRYMPPEQGAGNQAEVDIRSDVYALGSILYQLACGRTPFEGTLREILHQLHFDAPKPPSAYRADVPWELDAICLKALEKQKPDRYQSADALRADVLRFLEGQPIAARRSTPVYRIRKWIARNPLPAAVGAAVLLVIAALGSGWYATGQRAVAEHQRMILDPVRDALTQLEQGDHQGAVDKLKAARELLRPSDQITLPAEVIAHLPPEARTSLPDAPRLTSERLGSWIALGLRRRNIAQGQTLSARGNAQLESASAEHLTPADRRRRLLEAKRLLAEAQRLDRQNPAILRLLTRTHEELGKLAELEASIAVRKATLARAHRLVRNAAEALATGNAQQARTLYIQALAFDGRNESAQSGLVQADRISRKQAEAQEAAERKAQAEALLNEGKSIRARAQVAYRKGDLPERVRQRYFHAVESLQRALYLLPKHPGCTAELHALAREFAAVLVEQGYPELAGFMRRIGGVDPHDDFRRSLPRDPHLVLLEADAVVIRRAFGGVVRFQPTTALDSLRRWIESQKVRWRFRVEVRSHVVPGLHPQVYTTGLRIRLEDPAAGTRTAWTDVAFKERHLRPVVVDSQGRRLVRSFDRAHRFDGAAVIKQVERIVQGMVQRAKGSR